MQGSARRLAAHQFAALCSQAMVNVQMLAELEEVIQYKLVPERRETIKQMWWDRLQVRGWASLILGMRIRDMFRILVVNLATK